MRMQQERTKQGLVDLKVLLEQDFLLQEDRTFMSRWQLYN